MLAADLAGWVTDLAPAPEDLALADRSLVDTLAVTVAAREDPLAEVVSDLPEAARWGTLAHVLDFDDLHMESTTHVSAVCVPAALAAGGTGRAYLAGAGVMVRLGNALGWPHYSAGWHATCTAGAPGAAAAAAVAMGLDPGGIARAIALAIPAAGGVQRAFGTAAKPLQVGFAVDAGLRAARLARAGASADLAVVEQWLELLGGDASAVSLDGPAVPGGLAVKVYPCCYALQRPISAILDLLDGPTDARQVAAITVTTPHSATVPLIHSRPRTGMQAKFSMEYAMAGTVLDGYPGLYTFSDDAVARPDVAVLRDRVRVDTEPGGDGLLSGNAVVRVEYSDGSVREGSLSLPPGSPSRPPTHAELAAKVRDCAGDLAPALLGVTWDGAADFLRGALAVNR